MRFSDNDAPTSRLTPVLETTAGNLLPWQGAQTTWRNEYCQLLADEHDIFWLLKQPRNLP